jgi:hypothetical protein
MVHEEVEGFCLDRLCDAYNKTTTLFDRQLRRGAWGLTRGNESITSTAIALIGLSRASVDSDRIGIDRERTCEALITRAASRRYDGALGLIFWANRVTNGPSSAAVLTRFGWSLDDVERWTRPLETMEVGWLLSGLAHEMACAPSDPLRRAFRATRAVLLDRFVRRTRTFVHATPDARVFRRVRRWVANFADQIYSIQALGLACALERDDSSMEVAAQAAEQLIALQGRMGQWWWHYDARDGRVTQAYPVYSVHQYGMAPMALRSLARAGGPAHDQAIADSRRWLGANELDTSLIDRTAGTVWRAIERDEGALARQARRVRSVLGWKPRHPPELTALKVNRETRPYEWGWYLFAAALDRGRSPDPHHLI